MNLFIYFLNILYYTKIYEFNYNFESNSNNRMFISLNNSNYRESVIVNNQNGKFLLDSNLNNFSYKFRNNIINNYFFNYIEKIGDKIYYSKIAYQNKNIKKYFYDEIKYNCSYKHYIEIYFSINFIRFNNSKIYFKIYNNNKLLESEEILDNYKSFYKKLINYNGFNIIKVEIVNSKNNLINCVTCDNGYLYSYYFALLKTRLDEKNNNIFKNNYKFNDLSFTIS